MNPGYMTKFRPHCPDHPQEDLIEDFRAGDLICPECGLVVMEHAINVSAEWRFLEPTGTDPCRVGAICDPLLNGEDMSTVIGPMPMSRDGNYQLPTYIKRRVLLGTNNAIKRGFDVIAVMVKRLNTNEQVRDRAKALYKQIYDSKLIRTRSTDAKCAACIYIACRQENIPRSFKEVCAICNSSKKEIGRTYKQLMTALKLDLDLVGSKDFMTRFCSTLDVPVSMETVAMQIASNSMEIYELTGRSPLSIASAAIYMATHTAAPEYHREAGHIARVAGVALTTVNTIYMIMLDHLDKILPRGTNRSMLPMPNLDI
ncbi:transcription initiation factor IIB-like [Scaptodrosophila lebanonensis]|uniref:Transcription initiation factor IIB n=1 Tax=Drosophila lebanonensis TaxID=7225 RepID=A0A6J2TPN0_DROLE|nr:transcription initiation factor IIB-like [Scaptodrosophila lebanonensis]